MIPTPSRKRCQMALPPGVATLREADLYVAFYVLSNSIEGPSDDVDATGALGYCGTPNVHKARVIQLAWACASPGERKASTLEQRFVAIPGVVEGGVLGDVLLEFMDAVVHASPRLRLITYNMELNAGILLAEMARAKLCNAYNHFERIVRTRGFDLADPHMYGWLAGGQPMFPSLEEIAKNSALPWPSGLPDHLTGEDEAALYLHLTDQIRTKSLSECQRVGHVPVRVWKRCCLRDNGEFDYECSRCGIDLG